MIWIVKLRWWSYLCILHVSSWLNLVVSSRLGYLNYDIKRSWQSASVARQYHRRQQLRLWNISELYELLRTATNDWVKCFDVNDESDLFCFDSFPISISVKSRGAIIFSSDFGIFGILGRKGIVHLEIDSSSEASEAFEKIKAFSFWTAKHFDKIEECQWANEFWMLPKLTRNINRNKKWVTFYWKFLFALILLNLITQFI